MKKKQNKRWDWDDEEGVDEAGFERELPDSEGNDEAGILRSDEELEAEDDWEEVTFVDSCDWMSLSKQIKEKMSES